MKYRSRIYYTESDKALMSDRWQWLEGYKTDRSHVSLCGPSMSLNVIWTGEIRDLK